MAVVLLAMLAGPVRAEPDAPHTEMFTGFETSDNYTSGYVGGGYAFGKGLYDAGFRLRAVGAGRSSMAATMSRPRSTARLVLLQH